MIHRQCSLDSVPEFDQILAKQNGAGSSSSTWTYAAVHQFTEIALGHSNCIGFAAATRSSAL
jgi:hypothetical protein